MARSRDTMNRPDSSVLNSGAEPTVAAKAFEKAVKENSVTPAIATGFVPPVIKKEEETKSSAPSPFRQIKIEGEDGEKSSEPKKPAQPAIATGFIPMPGYMKKQEINPFKSNKAPVKRPVSASVNHAAAEAAGEIEEEIVEEEKDHSNERPSLTAALAGREVHSTFRPTGGFATQEKVNPFKHSQETKTASVSEPASEPEAPAERKAAGPKNRRSPFSMSRMGVEPEALEVAAVKPVEPKVEQPVEPEPEQPAFKAAEPEPEQPAFKAAEPEIEQAPAETIESEPEVVQTQETVAEPVQEPEEEPELVFPSYEDDGADIEPFTGASPFKPLDHEIDPNEEPELPKAAKAEPTYYTSGNEDKSRGGLLGGLFKRR